MTPQSMTAQLATLRALYSAPSATEMEQLEGVQIQSFVHPALATRRSDAPHVVANASSAHLRSDNLPPA